MAGNIPTEKICTIIKSRKEYHTTRMDIDDAKTEESVSLSDDRTERTDKNYKILLNTINSKH